MKRSLIGAQIRKSGKKIFFSSLSSTYSLFSDNFLECGLIHLVEFDDNPNSISKCIYDHKEGEIWHKASAPNNKFQFLTCYNK
jgi:hypothetical protein